MQLAEDLLQSLPVASALDPRFGFLVDELHSFASPAHGRQVRVRHMHTGRQRREGRQAKEYQDVVQLLLGGCR